MSVRPEQQHGLGVDGQSDPNWPPRVVLDTNSTLDWLVFRNPAMAPVAQAISTGSVRWAACGSMRVELAHMLGHASLARWQPDVPAALAVFDTCAHLLPEPLPTAPPRLRCTDPDDQVFIELALAQRARWLVTRDRALLKLARRARAFGLAVLPPEAWPAASPPAADRHRGPP